jgi:hypothetical protein
MRTHPLRLSAPLRPIPFAACAALLAGCPSTPPPAPTLSSIQAAIFTPSCTFSSCHSSAGNAGGLVLEAGVSFANLVGVPAQQSAAAQAGLFRVAPGNPSQSFLTIKLAAGTPAAYGDHMPDTGQQLGDADLNAIAQWISLGAQDD